MNESIVFWGLGGLISICSLLVVTLKNPVTAAVFLVIDLFLLGGIYAFQGADFVAAIQIIVYTGAILVLFLFVIMILNLDPDHLKIPKKGLFEKIFLGILIATYGYLAYKLIGVGSETAVSHHALPDNTTEVATLLFKKYVWPFEIVSFLILLSIVGSIAIAAKRKVDS
jgi:NADH-quinone oxidoreductase subunit J